MTLYAPAYYKDFACIADKCRHSCCVGWEIDVDDASMKKYAALSGGYGEVIVGSIDMSDTPHFRLGACERCPHLDEKGLCRIITELGEEYLCEICREHPRFYHKTARGREVGLGMACEEACRLILTCESPAILPIGEADVCALPDFDTVSVRDKIYALLFDTALPYPERRRKIAEAYGLLPKKRTDGEWRELLASLEYLNEAHRPRFAAFDTDANADEDILARALAYFVFRHVSPAENEDEAGAAVGFSLFCEQLLASLIAAGGDPFESARILSEEIEYSEENTEAIKFEFYE